MREPAPEAARRSRWVYIRVSPALEDRLRAAADAAGVTTSEWARRVVAQATGLEPPTVSLAGPALEQTETHLFQVRLEVEVLKALLLAVVRAWFADIKAYGPDQAQAIVQRLLDQARAEAVQALQRTKGATKDGTVD